MPLAPAEIEIKLLSALQTPQDLQKVRDSGVDALSFIVYGPVFDYLVEYVHNYQEMPRPADVEARFKDTDQALTLETPGKVEYYATELRKIALARHAMSTILTRVGAHSTNLQQNPDETVRLLTQELQQLQKSRNRNIAFFDRDALARYRQLEERVAATTEGRIIGIPTGLKLFDDFQEGWQPGEAIMWAAPKGAGKSWMLMKHATVAYKHGCKVLYFSPEMSLEECALRFDVVLACEYHRSLQHTQLKSGSVLVDMAAYKEWLEFLTARADFICVDSAGELGFTLPGMLSLINEYQPDLVCLDGIHLVKDPGGRNDWSVIKEAADGLKADAQRRKSVVIWVGQVDRESMRNSSEPASHGGHAAYGKAAVEAANRFLTLGMDSDDPFHRVFKVPNNRSGREWHIKQYLFFDVDNGHIEQREIQDVGAFGVLNDGSEI